MITHFVGRHRRGGLPAGRGPGRCQGRLAAWLPDGLGFAITVLLVLAVLMATLIVTLDTVAWAQAPEEPGVSSIPEVVNRMRLWLVGILFAVATFFASVAGFRYMWANGDTTEIEKAKLALRGAGIGYALAILAPLLVTIATSFVA